jgi:hypothetical protein
VFAVSQNHATTLPKDVRFGVVYIGQMRSGVEM